MRRLIIVTDGGFPDYDKIKQAVYNIEIKLFQLFWKRLIYSISKLIKIKIIFYEMLYVI